MGRHTVNPEEYNPNWEKEIIAAYKDGKSDTWIKANCFKSHRVSNDLWDRWIDEIENFSEAIKHGRKLSQSWWEDQSQDHACGRNLDANATSLIWNMSNRFRREWKQRQPQEEPIKFKLEIEGLDKLGEFLEENGVDITTL